MFLKELTFEAHLQICFLSAANTRAISLKVQKPHMSGTASGSSINTVYCAVLKHLRSTEYCPLTPDSVCGMRTDCDL